MYNLDQFTHKFGLLFVCEWIGPGYTSINSGKNALISIIKSLIVNKLIVWVIALLDRQLDCLLVNSKLTFN